MAQATAADKAHFLRIAEANAAIEVARQKAAGNEDPGAKIEQALRLSNELLRHVAPESKSERKRFSLTE